MGIGIEADHLHADGLADLQGLRRVVDAAPGDVGDVQQGDGAAEIDREAALDAAVDGAVDADIALEGALQQRPGFLTAGFFAGEDDGAVPVLIAFDEKLDHVARLDFGLLAGVDEFLQGDAAFGFEADIDDDEFIGEAYDASGDDGAVESGIAAEGFVEQVRKTLFAGAGGGGRAIENS